MNNIIKSVLYLITTLAILGITAGSTSIIEIRELKTKVQYIERNSENMDKAILSELRYIRTALEQLKDRR